MDSNIVIACIYKYQIHKYYSYLFDGTGKLVCKYKQFDFVASLLIFETIK